MAQLVQQSPQMMILPAATNPGAKDSRWLTLEVCREFQRAKCSRTENECKFAHPPPHVEVQNGRVVACFDSIKGKCQRKDPPCKYLHPPQHLREQLLQNGRNNLILKNLQLQAYHQQTLLPVAGSKAYVPTVIQGQYPYLAHPGSSQAPPPPTATAVLRPPTLPPAVTASSPYDATHYPGLTTLSAMPAPAGPPGGYNPYIATSLAPSGLPGSPEPPSIMSQTLAHSMLPTKAVRADKFETPSQNGDTVTQASLVDTLAFPTYLTQATAPAPAALPPGMVLAKKRPRDPQDELLLQSTMPGVVPAYKRIAVGDMKGGYPVYQTNHLYNSPLQQASLMQLQQPPYVPMSFAGQPPSVPRF